MAIIKAYKQVNTEWGFYLYDKEGKINKHMKNIKEEIESELTGFSGATFSNHTQVEDYIRGMLERISVKALELKASEESNADLKCTVIKKNILNDFNKEILYPEIKGWGIEPSQVLAIKQFISKSIDKALSARDEEWMEKIESFKINSEPLLFNSDESKKQSPEDMSFEYDPTIRYKGLNERLDDLINSMK